MKKPNILDHLNALETSTDSDTQNSIESLKSSILSWNKVAEVGQGMPYNLTLNQNVSGIIGNSTITPNTTVQSAFKAIDTKYATSMQTVDTTTLIEEKQSAFDQLSSSFPSNKITSLQQNYIQQMTQVSTTLNVQSSMGGSSTVQQVEASSSLLSKATQAYSESPNDTKSLLNYQSALANYQNSLDNFSSNFPRYQAEENKLIDQLSTFNSVISGQGDTSSIAFSQQVNSLSTTLDALPQLPSNVSSQLQQSSVMDQSSTASLQKALGSIKGPYTASFESAVSQSTLPESSYSSDSQASIDKLNSLSKTAVDLSSTPISISSAMSNEIESSLATVSEGLMTSNLSKQGSSIDLSFIKNTLDSMVNLKVTDSALPSQALSSIGMSELSNVPSQEPSSIGMSSLSTVPSQELSSIDMSSLSTLPTQLQALNAETLKAVVFTTPGFLSLSNLPSLSAPFSDELTSLSSALQSMLDSKVSASDDPSLFGTQGLLDKVNSVLSYSDNFMTLDKLNMETLQSELNLPSSLISTSNAASSAQSIPDLTSMVPDIDALLSMAQDGDNIDSIEGYVNDINASLQEQTSTSVGSSELAASMNNFIPEASTLSPVVAAAVGGSSSDTSTEGSETGTQSANAGTQYSEEEQTPEQIQINQDVAQLILDVTIAISTYTVVTGAAAKLNFSSSSQASSAMATCMGSSLTCIFGIGTSSLSPLRPTVSVNNKAASNINDIIPIVNVSSFSGCTNPASPLMNPYSPFWTCTPMVSAFIPTNPVTLIQGAPVNTINNMTTCSFATGGVLSFSDPSQTTTVSS